MLCCLARSGALPLEEATLHVVLAVTHAFAKDIVDTVVQVQASAVFYLNPGPHPLAPPPVLAFPLVQDRVGVSFRNLTRIYCQNHFLLYN